MVKKLQLLGGLAAVLTAGVGASFLLQGEHSGPSRVYAQQAAVAQGAHEELLVGAEKLSQAFRAAAKALRPSVVTITAKVDQQVRPKMLQRRGQIPNLPEEFRGLLPEELLRQFDAQGIDRADPSDTEEREQSPEIKPGKSQSVKIGVGSGVIVSKDGYIITNNHVVAKADALQVQLSDNRTFTAKVIGTDPKSDVALLKIDVQGLVPASLGDSSAMEVGDWVLAIGSPFELDQTVTAGIVSAVNRSTQNDILPYEDFLQTDAAINPGNSGGPLVNLRGEVVGINTAINSSTGTSAGVGFAIPSNTVAHVMQDLRESGHVRRGFIGAQLADVTYETLREQKLPEDVIDGVVIDGVQENGPAAKAKLQKGDIVTKANRRVITSVQAMRNTVAMVRPGKAVDLDIYREGRPMKISITVEEMTDQKLAAMSPRTEIESLKMAVEPLNAALAKDLGVQDIDAGVVVVAMDRRGKATQLGLRPEDIITEVNGKPITNGAEMLAAIEAKPDRLQMTVRRGDSEMVLRLDQR